MKNLQTFNEFLNESSDTILNESSKTVVNLSGDKDTVRHEQNEVNNWNFDWLVKMFVGEVGETDSNVEIIFNNGDFLKEKYDFRPYGPAPTVIEGKINGRGFIDKNSNFNDKYLDQYGSFAKALVYFYLFNALNIKN